MRSLNYTHTDFSAYTLPELYLRFCIHYKAAKDQEKSHAR